MIALLRDLGPDGIVAACCAVGMLIMALHPGARVTCADAYRERP